MQLSLLAVLLLGGTTPIISEPPQAWEVLTASDTLTVWQRPVVGSGIREVQVEAVLEASSRQIWNVIRDVAKHPEFLPYVAEARVVRDAGEVRYVYQRVSPPVVADRDYTLGARAYEDHETLVFQQDFWLENAVGPAPQDGVVRVEVVQGRWILEPLNPKRTRILYQLHTDPGGSIPSWLINFGQRYSLPRLLNAVERRAQDPTWTP